VSQANESQGASRELARRPARQGVPWADSCGRANVAVVWVRKPALGQRAGRLGLGGPLGRRTFLRGIF
jgi:hypothetical protein